MVHSARRECILSAGLRDAGLRPPGIFAKAAAPRPARAAPELGIGAAGGGQFSAAMLDIVRATGDICPAVIHVIFCGDCGDAAALLVAMGRAAAPVLGRTLLATVSAHGGARSHAAADSDIAQLYHRELPLRGFLQAITQMETPHGGEFGAFEAILVSALPAQDAGMALAVSPYCTGSIVVVWAGRTKLPAIRSLCAGLHGRGARVLGSLLLTEDGIA